MPRSGRYAMVLGAAALLGGGASGVSMAAEPAAAIAAIAVEPSDGGVRLVGRAVGLSQATVDARMKIERAGSGGKTSTSQGGTFTLEKGSSVDVATVGLSMAAGDRLSVELVLTANGQPIARSVVEVGQ